MNQNTRIRISFLVIALIAAVSYFAGYRFFFKAADPEPIQESEEAYETEDSFTTEIAQEDTAFETAANDQHVLFFIKEKDGYLDVYLADGVTLYMTTGIAPEDLEEEWQEQLEEGIAFYSMDSLYEFLESYSS